MPDTPPPTQQTSPQAPGHTPQDPPELARLKVEKAISDQEREIAENQRKRVVAMLPPDIKAPEAGTTKVEGDHPIESQILAYRALDELAALIATKVVECDPRPTAVVIHADTEVNALLALQGFDAQLDLIRGGLQAELDNAEAPIADAQAVAQGTAASAGAGLEIAPLVIGSTLRAAADAASLFRVNVAFRYKDLTISELALVASVVGHLARDENRIPLYHSTLLPPHLDDEKSDIRDKLMALIPLRGEIDRKVDEATAVTNTLKDQIATLNAEIAQRDAADPKQDSAPAKRLVAMKQRASDQLSTLCTRLQAASAAFDAFQGAILKADESSGVSALARLIRAEKLKKVASAAHWLLLKVAAAGGGYKTKQFLWWPTSVLYSGGAIAEFILFDPSGKIVTAGVHPKYTGFIKIRERPEATYDLESLTT